MKVSLKCFLAFFILFPAAGTVANAGQQVYLSESPNARYRVIIEQVIDRRVGEKVFFRYPLIVVNTKNPKRHFEVMDAGSPMIHETDKQTYKVRWDGADSNEPSSIHFDWAPDSLKFFIQMEVIEGSWKTFFVDVNTGKTIDITADLHKGLLRKIESKGWDCQQPTMKVVKWTKPHLAFLRLTSICGKDNKKSNPKLFYQNDSILFDSVKMKSVANCVECKEEKAGKIFEKYFISTLPTPTPTPEETPTVQ